MCKNRETIACLFALAINKQPSLPSCLQKHSQTPSLPTCQSLGHRVGSSTHCLSIPALSHLQQSCKTSHTLHFHRSRKHLIQSHAQHWYLSKNALGVAHKSVALENITSVFIAIPVSNSALSPITTQTFIKVHCRRISGYGLCVGS